MGITEVIVGHRILVQSGAETKEHAQVMGVNDNGLIIVKLSDGTIRDIHPQFILKDFEA